MNLIDRYDPAVVRERVEMPAEYRKMLLWLMPNATDQERSARWKAKFGSSHASLRTVTAFHNIPKYTVVGTQPDGNCLYRCFAKTLLAHKLVGGTVGVKENQLVALLRNRLQDVVDVALAGIDSRGGHADTVRMVYGLEEGEDRRDVKGKPFETVEGLEILASLCQVDVLLLYTDSSKKSAGELHYKSMFVSSNAFLDGMMTMGRGNMTLGQMDEWAQEVAAELRRPVHAPTNKRLIQTGTRGLLVLHGINLSGQHLSGHFEIIRPTVLAMPLRNHAALARLERVLNVSRMMSLAFTGDVGATIDIVKTREPLAKALGFGTSVLVNERLVLLLGKGSRFSEGSVLGNATPADPRINPFTASLFTLAKIVDTEAEADLVLGDDGQVKAKKDIDVKHREDEHEARLRAGQAADKFTFHDGTPHEVFTDMPIVLNTTSTPTDSATLTAPTTATAQPAESAAPPTTLTPVQIAGVLKRGFLPFVRPPDPAPPAESTSSILPPITPQEHQAMDEVEDDEFPAEAEAEAGQGEAAEAEADQGEAAEEEAEEKAEEEAEEKAEEEAEEKAEEEAGAGEEETGPGGVGGDSDAGGVGGDSDAGGVGGDSVAGGVGGDSDAGGVGGDSVMGGVSLRGMSLGGVSIGTDVWGSHVEDIRLRGKLLVRARRWSEVAARNSYEGVEIVNVLEDDGDGDVDVAMIRGEVARKMGIADEQLDIMNMATEKALANSDLIAIRLGMDLELDLLILDSSVSVLPIPIRYMNARNRHEAMAAVDIDLVPANLLPSRKDLTESPVARLILFLVGAYRVGISIVREIEGIIGNAHFTGFDNHDVFEQFIRYRDVIIDHLLGCNHPSFVFAKGTGGDVTMGMECVAAMFDEEDDEGLVIVKRGLEGGDGEGQGASGEWMMADNSGYHTSSLPLSLAQYTIWQRPPTSNLRVETFEWTKEVQDLWTIKTVRDIAEFATADPSSTAPLLSSPLLSPFIPDGDLTPEILQQMASVPEGEFEQPKVVQFNAITKACLVKVGHLLIQFSKSAASLTKGWFYAAEALGGSRGQLDMPSPPQLISICKLRPNACWAIVMNCPASTAPLSKHILQPIIMKQSEEGANPEPLSVYDLISRTLASMTPADRQAFEEQGEFGRSPGGFVELRSSVCSGNGIFAVGTIPSGTFLGVYTGKVRRDEAAGPGEHYVWEIDTLQDGSKLYVDGDYRKHKSAGWLSVLNSAPTEDDANVLSSVLPGNSRTLPRLGYFTKRIIRPGEQLRIFYGESYASFIKSMYVEVVERCAAVGLMLGNLIATWHTQYRLCLGGGRVGVDDVCISGLSASPLRVPSSDPAAKVILPYEHMVHESAYGEGAFDQACQEDISRWSRDLMQTLMEMTRCNSDPRNVFVDTKQSRMRVAEAFMRGIDNAYGKSSRRGSVLRLTGARELASVPFLARDDLVRLARRMSSKSSSRNRPMSSAGGAGVDESLAMSMLPVAYGRSRLVPSNDALIQMIDDDSAATMSMVKSGFSSKVGGIMRTPFKVLAFVSNGLMLEEDISEGSDRVEEVNDERILGVARQSNPSVSVIVRPKYENLFVAS
jgi:hypothetical protein